MRHAGTDLRCVVLDDDPVELMGMALVIQTTIEAGLTWVQAAAALAYFRGETNAA